MRARRKRVTQRGAEGVSQPQVSPAPHGWGAAWNSTPVEDVEAARRGPRSEEGIMETRATVPVCSARRSYGRTHHAAGEYCPQVACMVRAEMQVDGAGLGPSAFKCARGCGSWTWRMSAQAARRAGARLESSAVDAPEICALTAELVERTCGRTAEIIHEDEHRPRFPLGRV